MSSIESQNKEEGPLCIREAACFGIYYSFIFEPRKDLLVPSPLSRFIDEKVVQPHPAHSLTSIFAYFFVTFMVCLSICLVHCLSVLSLSPWVERKGHFLSNFLAAGTIHLLIWVIPCNMQRNRMIIIKKIFSLLRLSQMEGIGVYMLVIFDRFWNL